MNPDTKKTENTDPNQPKPTDFDSLELAFLGSLLPGIVHNLATPLSGVIGATQLLEMRVGEQERLLNELERGASQSAEALKVQHQMRDFTDARDPATPDELWLLQHPAIYTLGQASRLEHLLDAGRIPVLKVDRGGQVTYHGPGQLIAYLLLDLKRAGLGVRGLVQLLETTVIDLLAAQGVDAQAKPNAPGVYVEGAKIASLGLRVRRYCSYHGLALNVDLDLEPFSRINPCGYPGLPVTRLVDLGVNLSLEKIAEELAATLAGRLDRVAIIQT